MDRPANSNRAKGHHVTQIPELRLDNLPISDTSDVSSHRTGAHNRQRPRFKPPPNFQYLASEVQESVEQRLNHLLRKKLPCYVGTETPIAQPHVLRDILTHGNILDLLKEYKANDDIPGHVDIVRLCREVRGDGHPSCIVILAMLILVDKGHTIWEVLQDQVFDDHLPLVYDRPERPTLFLQDKSSGQWRPPRCFLKTRTWGTQTKLDICQWQWYLTVPYMKVDITGSTFQAYQETFGKYVKLPWSSKSRDGEVMKNESTQGWGGYSAVYRYHIDDRFHGFHKVLAKIGLNGGKGFFALKVLNFYTESDKAAFPGFLDLFRNERQQLSRFNGSVHEHLVTLLAAFEQEGVAKNYFIFPWADCDLSGYWESQQARDVRWVAAQLNGLVGALDKIHNPPHLANIYGRHGDLKPDNILWYTPYKGDPRGILVISDMGFTAVNSEISRSKQTNGKARTPTYRAPELDIHDANVSREYDIWSLGCIFLEMMMWILGGDALIQEFKKERMTVENGVKTPVFFAFDDQRQAVVKQEVIQCMDTIRSHRDSTKFICDVVDVIQDRMIIPRADKRSKVRDLSRRFNEIHETCKRRPAYYKTPHQAPRRVTPRPKEHRSSLPHRSTQTHKSISIPVEMNASLAEFHESGATDESVAIDEPLVIGEPGMTNESIATVTLDKSENVGVVDEPAAIAEFSGFAESAETVGSTRLTRSTDIASSIDHTRSTNMTEHSTAERSAEDESSNNAPTEYSVSDQSGLPPDIAEKYIQEFAQNLYQKLRSEGLSIQALERSSGSVADSLRGFADRIGFEAKDSKQRDVMYFTRRRRMQVTYLTSHICYCKHTADFSRKIQGAFLSLAKVEGKTPEEEEEEEEDSKKVTRGFSNPEVWQWISELSEMTEPANEVQETLPPSIVDSDKIPEADDDPIDDNETTLAYRQYGTTIETSAAYAWLVGTLQREAILQSAEQNQMEDIRAKIAKSLPRPAKISRRVPSKVHKVTFNLHWDPFAFVKDQGFTGPPEKTLLGAITFTGSPSDAQALVCSEYLTQTWPTTGKGIVHLLAELMRTSRGAQCGVKLVDGTALTATIKNEETIITAEGVAESIAEVGQQLAWTGAALRSAPAGLEPNLHQCIPTIQIPNKENLTKKKEIVFELDFEIKSPSDNTIIPGGCWHKMLRSPVLASGFPIRAKSVKDSGVEMPLDIMACLAGSHRAIEFDGKVILKGFSTMLTAVKQVEDLLIWHYTFHADKTRIPFFEARPPMSDDIHLGLLEPSRHIIGWCSSAKYYAGGPEANHDIEDSGLPRPDNGYLLDKASLSGGKGINFNASLSISIKSLSPHYTREGYFERLGYLEKQFVILWDEGDKRGWLVNGTSALLYLVRSRLKNFSSSNWGSELNFDFAKLKEATEKYHPTRSVAEVLRNKDNRELEVWKGRTERYTEHKTTGDRFESTNTLKQSHEVFEAFVERYMSYLEQILDHQTGRAEESGVKLKAHARKRLEGWDFFDLINSQNPRPRVTVLDRLGWGWVDFARSINAVTLFGRGFGSLIRPAEPQGLCPDWQKLPKGKYYLAASQIDLMAAMRTHGNRHSDPAQLVHGILWHSPSLQHCHQKGHSSSHGKSCDPVQVLLPSISKHVPRMHQPAKIDQRMSTAAFVFGHSFRYPLRWPSEGSSLEVAALENPDGSLEDPESQTEERGAYSRVTDSHPSTSQRAESSVQLNIRDASSVEPSLATSLTTMPAVLSSDQDLDPASTASHQGGTAASQPMVEKPTNVELPPLQKKFRRILGHFRSPGASTRNTSSKDAHPTSSSSSLNLVQRLMRHLDQVKDSKSGD